ncbi:hypothetical protein BD289DRAFT_227058 [Coniella lustricola]|uniref:Uncharacterized protein n=1 Tax=Coniella lustricola TaxID=2025994 RepID=A0A2T3AAN5_9PEZI|nr:hypothetical protein BD289DRAFT_227058 [Coniella lustricola]
MARLNNLSLLLATTAFSAAVRAYTDIETSDSIQADTPTDVELSVDQNDVDMYGTGIRVYLATTPPGWGTGPACWLINDTSLDTTLTTITVPAAVAPDQTVLALSLSIVNLEEGYTYTDGYSYSNDFTFHGGSGAWSALELNGISIFDPDSTPCTAMQCSRDCAAEYYPDGGDIEDNQTFEDFYKCIYACPGTTYPPWDDISGGSDGGSSATATGVWSTSSTSAAQATKTKSSSVSGTSTTTIAATASSTSSPSTSASSTSSAAAASTSAVTTSAANRTPVLLIPLATTALLAGLAGFFL